MERKCYSKLKLLRVKESLTQTQLGAILNCSQRVYSDYERGRLDIPTRVLCDLADYYRVSVDYLLDRADN